MKKVVDIFAILGVLASIVSTLIAYLAYKQESSNNAETGIKKVQVAIAGVIAPSDYSLTSTILDVIPENSEFTISKGDTALITQTAKLPFALRESSSDSIARMKLNGSSVGLYEGDKIKLKNTDCFMWLYHIENPSYSFQIRCGEKI